MRSQCSGYLEPHWGECCAAFVFSVLLLFLFFCFPPLPPFFPPLLSQCDGCPHVPVCVGAHGWVAGIASHGSILVSRGWLITVEAPGHPGHPPSTQLDAVGRGSCNISNKFTD